MKLKQIYVRDLFGIYEYDIELIDPSESRVTIIDAPNGMGKTTVLKLIKACLHAEVEYIDTIPFSCFKLEFDDGQTVELKKKDVYYSFLGQKLIGLRDVFFNAKNKNEQIKLENIEYIVNGKEHSVFIEPDTIVSIMRRVRFSKDTAEISLADFISYTREEFNFGEYLFLMDELNDALNAITESYSIYYIKTNRLYVPNKNKKDRREHIVSTKELKNDMVSAVEKYQTEIQRMIQEADTDFVKKSEELDREFPQKVLNAIFKHNAEVYDDKTISNILLDLDNNRSRLNDLGLISKTGNTLLDVPKGMDLSEETRVFLTMYIEDNISKLKVYTDLSDDLERLRSIINGEGGFSDKVLRFSAKEGIEFFSKNGRSIPIDRLSSGEKNYFALFYQLIFDCSKHSLIMIDEPEISLHVAWQRMFIDELKEICKMKGFQAIVATHSPDIVENNYDYMIDLEDKADVKE